VIFTGHLALLEWCNRRGVNGPLMCLGWGNWMHRTFWWEPLGRCPFWRQRRRGKDNIKMDLMKLGCEVVGTSSGLYPMAGFDISKFEFLGTAIIVLIMLW